MPNSKLNQAILRVAKANPEFRKALQAELRGTKRSMYQKEAKGMKVPRIDSSLVKVFKDRLGVTDLRLAQFIWGLFLRAGEIATEEDRKYSQEEPQGRSYELLDTNTESVTGRRGRDFFDDAITADVEYTSYVSIKFTPDKTSSRDIQREFLRLARTILKKNGLDENEVWSLWAKYVAPEVADELTMAHEEYVLKYTDDLEDLYSEYAEAYFSAYVEVNYGGGRTSDEYRSGDEASSWYVNEAIVNLNYESTPSGDLVQEGSCSMYGRPSF